MGHYESHYNKDFSFIVFFSAYFFGGGFETGFSLLLLQIIYFTFRKSPTTFLPLNERPCFGLEIPL